ncbi:MAG: hypothetical protein M3N34_09645 [Pseudomonadota bacterium]|nr:hypothetical protein [Pseudomonadota bacterium]
MIKRLAWLTCCAALALSGCGVRTDLKPKVGHSLPVAPYGAREQPTSVELLTPRPQARPAINVELRLKSEVRADDPFDLPPP